MHLVYLIVGLKTEEVTSGPPEQVYSTVAKPRCWEVGGRFRFRGHRQRCYIIGVIFVSESDSSSS